MAPMDGNETRFLEIGRRLRAYRLGRGLTAEHIADRLGLSRAAIYRLEKGEVVKIETIQRIADLLDVSVASLLGVSVEYYDNAVAYFERMRQLEEEAEQVLAHFSPFSYLLSSDDYARAVAEAIRESTPTDAGDGAAARQVEELIRILQERRGHAGRRKPLIVSIVGLQDLERLLRDGVIGRFDLAPEVWAERRAVARREVKRLADMMREEPMGIQIGLVEETLPQQTFQIFRQKGRTFVAMSPFRFADHPNIRNGVAMVTETPEAVHLFEGLIGTLWQRARKGADGARRLMRLLQTTGDGALREAP
ncbi:helix-turn-helix transcriptional regulator [Chelatococcus sp. SYSU_G07232]|uniref:Helix-turn-helix transcriptional regulator n=1 Tax=Chelatococcus albus TaxID=3047466 RepID=A0ABT7AMS4_9HYPH|nr:helix-turn-helix transcriptional regulator [Chelatococcus sp. SYSU_G07232]MDJ1160104.1 helix-turn-helix transcriptional regulator [Chelatococcus sp. SYSU_G07232]